MSEESIEDLKAQLICMQEKLEAKEREVEQLVHEVRDAKVVAMEAQEESARAVSHANSLQQELENLEMQSELPSFVLWRVSMLNIS